MRSLRHIAPGKHGMTWDDLEPPIAWGDDHYIVGAETRILRFSISHISDEGSDWVSHFSISELEWWPGSWREWAAIIRKSMNLPFVRVDILLTHWGACLQCHCSVVLQCLGYEPSDPVVTAIPKIGRDSLWKHSSGFELIGRTSR